ncbi:DUF1015 family protein [Spiractinospora alimapuensis]|uniref:DUF1015 family protein n=1 Tax=Spiractinospora alimapuensis TaxID=2820884 RepID=UPI001F43ADA4|nr:DUF1015 family protein [Spiractinospora alimapuensis]QVQ50463.1 DUF1015 family protein [Spiractinospora alimapuensis]
MAARTSAEASETRAGVGVRPPRLLLADRDHAGYSHDPEDVAPLMRVGAMTRLREPAVVVYQIAEGAHQQTGVVVEVPIADYRDRRVRPHEATDPGREEGVLEHLTEARFQNTPVMLTHQPRPALSEVLRTITAAEPDVDLDTIGPATHRAWVVREAHALRVVGRELGALDALYITDGHHRMAAAERFAAGHPEIGPDHAAAFTLGALFPSDEMRILGYPRSVVRPAGRTARDILAILERSPAVARVDDWPGVHPPPPSPGAVALALDGRWYRMWLRDSTDGLLSQLDSVRLDHEVLVPLFGQHAVRYVRGASEAETLDALLTDHDGVGFLPHPATMADVVAVSDAGLVMPPKSTWFDPKACQGLFSRQLVPPDA